MIEPPATVLPFSGFTLAIAAGANLIAKNTLARQSGVIVR